MDGAPRFGMLETIREFALEQLAASGEAQELRVRHTHFFLHYSEQMHPATYSVDRALPLAQLEAEHDNLRAALGSAATSSDVEMGLRLAKALWWFWVTRGRLSEGRRWLEMFLYRRETPEGEVATLDHAFGFRLAGSLARYQGDYAQATHFYNEGLALYRQLGDEEGIADVLLELGKVGLYTNDYTRAEALLAEGLARHQRMGNQLGAIMALTSLGRIAEHQGDFDQATARYEASLALQQAENDLRGELISQLNLGRVARYQGNHPRATALLEASLARHREIGDRLGVVWSMYNLACVAKQRGDDSQASELYRESLTTFRDLNEKWGMALCLEGLAGVANAQGQAERAARLYAAAGVVRDAMRAPVPPCDRGEYEHNTAAVQAKLGRVHFEAARLEGRAMTLEEAVEYALQGGEGGDQ